MSNFWRNYQTSLRSGCIIYIPTSWVRQSAPHQYLVLSTFYYFSHLNRHAGVSHRSFNLHFLSDKWCWASFHVLICHPYIFSDPMSILDTIWWFWLSACLFSWCRNGYKALPAHSYEMGELKVNFSDRTCLRGSTLVLSPCLKCLLAPGPSCLGVHVDTFPWKICF